MNVFGTRPKTYIRACAGELLTASDHAVTGRDVGLLGEDRLMCLRALKQWLGRRAAARSAGLESFPCASC